MPVSKLLIELNGTAEKFIAEVGVDDASRDGSEAEFIILGDKKILWRSGIMKKGDQSKEVNIDIKGLKRLGLLVTRGSKTGSFGPDFGPGPGAGAPPAPGAMPPAGIPGGPGAPVVPGTPGFMPRMDLADWANARIEYNGSVQPEPISNSSQSLAKPDILTPPAPKSPRINGAKVIGATPGKLFLFTIPISGVRPMQITLENLPKSLVVNAETGIIEGVAPVKGTYVVKVHVKNQYGEASSELKIVIGDLIALTPPMGWNSWNAWGTKVDEEKVKAAADQIVEKLRDYGWTYINIDDGWQAAERTADGELLGNEKFPDMKRLSNYVHSKGLKFGIYSSPGTTTCGGYLGSYQHESLDADLWGDWGVDYLKYDWCSYFSIQKDNSLAELKKPYQIMKEALNQSNRDIVYALCQYGMGNVSSWGAEIGGNVWRTSGDIQDSWKSLKQTGFNQNSNADFVNPGHWNDPDMLVIGEVGGWGSNIHNTKLTPDEQYTHISLWCLMASPLLIGCNLNKLDDFTLNLITNNEVIAVNQDPLGKQAKQLVKGDEYQVWAKDMEDGSKVVGLFFTGAESDNPVDLFNWGDTQDQKTMKIALKWTDLGITGKHSVRDVWRQKDIGVFSDTFEAVVKHHGVVLVKLSRL